MSQIGLLVKTPLGSYVTFKSLELQGSHSRKILVMVARFRSAFQVLKIHLRVSFTFMGVKFEFVPSKGYRYGMDFRVLESGNLVIW